MVEVEKDNDLLYECKDDTQTTPLNLENRNEMELIPEIVTLKEKLENSEKELRKMGELESELQKEREKTKSLNEKIQELQDDSSLTKKLREMRLNTYYLERELKNANIDKRLVDRELKDVNEVNNQLVKQLEMQKNKMKEDKKNHEVALLELNSMNESFSIEIIKLKDKEKTLQILMHEDDKIKDNLNKLIKDLTFVNGVKEKTLERLHSELKDMKAKLDQYRNENIKRAEELDILNKEKVDLQNRLSNAEREHQQFHSKFLALGEACVLLENQLITLEKLNETYNSERKTFNSKLETLTSELRTAKEEIEQAEQFANQEKSSKLDAEMKVQRMEEVIELLKVENEDYKKKLSKNEEFSDTLSEQIIMDEEEITNLQISLRFSEGQIKDLVMENRRLKEEASDYITRFHNTKQMNYELNRQVNELKENNNLLKAHVHDLDCVLKEKNSYYKEQKIKADATSKQQIKLIDYLQTKIEESQNKKKSFTLFGHSKKENLPPISQPINHKDMEFQLHYDRSKQTPNRRKSDVSRKTKIETQKLVQSSSSQSKNFPRKNSLQRMQHNIPHRFESKLCTKSTKCEHCLNTIVLGRNMSVCKECRISTHSNCSATFASSCGLPLEEVNVYQNITFETTSTSQNATTSKGNANVESTIKIFGQSGSWENRYAVLTNTHLKVYAEKSERHTSNPEQIFELKSEGGHGKVLLEPLKSEIDVIVADNDLPFLIKLEILPHTTCWPSKAFIFLTLSIQDRDMWYKALQKFFQKDNGNLFCETIMTLPEGLTVNCVLDLNEDTRAVGTTKGLFCCYKGDLVFVEGFVEVHHMALMPLTKTIAMIVNAKNVLITCYLDHLINVAQYKAYLAKINFKYDVVDVKGLNGFHLLESCKEGGHKMFCVATPKQLIIMRYDEKEEKFLPLRILDTAEPTGTILFTDSSIIVGADKFFKIDLATFIAEEFLDESNPQLQNILKSYNTRMKPYPLSVVEVSDNPREYLVSFNEFSIFVDENGNPSRKRQWTFKHLPLGVFYVQQHLYVVEFCAVELRSVTVDTCASEQEEQHESDVSRIKLNKFQFVGTNKRGIYVCHKNAIELIEGRRCIPTNDSSLLETENTDDSSGRFSFSASMFQSLDGHLDLNIPDVENVTFTQTSL